MLGRRTMPHHCLPGHVNPGTKSELTGESTMKQIMTGLLAIRREAEWSSNPGHVLIKSEFVDLFAIGAT